MEINKKLIISIAVIALGILIILALVWYFVSGQKSRTTNTNGTDAGKIEITPTNHASTDGEGEGVGTGVSEDPVAYFKIVSTDLIRDYNTYQYGNYSNLKTVALQSTPELAKNINDYIMKISQQKDTSLKLGAEVKDSSFVLKSFAGGKAAVEITLTVYSTVNNQNSKKTLTAELVFVKQGSEWLLEQINNK
jgi:S-layer protein (TIGR01564 family)